MQYRRFGKTPMAKLFLEEVVENVRRLLNPKVSIGRADVNWSWMLSYTLGKLEGGNCCPDDSHHLNEWSG